MRIGHTGAATPAVSLEEDLRIAAQVGAEGFEVWIPKLPASLERPGLEALQAAFRGRAGAPVWLAPIEDVLFRDQAGAEETTATVHRLAEIARRLGASWLVLTPGTRPDGADERDVRAEGRGRLSRLLELALRYDVGLALSTSGRPTAAVQTIRTATALVDAVGRRGLALALDLFELHAARETPTDLQAHDPRTLALVRLADAPPEIEPGALRDAHRLVPGTGIVPLGAWTTLIHRLGADVPAVVAVPAPTGADPTTWAARLREAALFGTAADGRGAIPR